MNFWKSKLNFLSLYPKHNIPMGYKYKPNHEYFHKIDSEYKSYILGLLYADGSIYQPKGNRQLKLHISLQDGDGYILDKFAKEVINREVINYLPPSVAKNNWKSRNTVTIISNILCSKLIEYGCNINKSTVGMSFPTLNKQMIPHFIRGFMDGDGCITIGKIKYSYIRKKSYKIKNPHSDNYRIRLAFTSTDKKFLEELVKYLPIEKYLIEEKLRKQMVYTLWIGRKQDVQNCINYLYKDANFFMKRKYDKVLEFNKIIKSQAEDISSEGLETT